MKVDLSRRCECGRKQGRRDRWFYEWSEGSLGMACKSCGRRIVQWSGLPENKKDALASLADKYRSSDWNRFVFGTHQ